MSCGCARRREKIRLSYEAFVATIKETARATSQRKAAARDEGSGSGQVDTGDTAEGRQGILEV
jgi:hypothetical protein